MSALAKKKSAPKFDDYAVGAWSVGLWYPTALFFSEGHYFWGSVVVSSTLALMFFPWLEKLFFRTAFYKFSVATCLLLIIVNVLVFGNEPGGFWSSMNIFELEPCDIIIGVLGFAIIGFVSHSYSAVGSKAEVSGGDKKS